MIPEQIEKELKRLRESICCQLDSDIITAGDLAYIKHRYKKLLKNIIPEIYSEEIKSIKKLIGRLTCKVCSTIQIQLTNEEGDSDLNYPLGVFSVTNNYIGIANNETEYTTLWNSNIDNQLIGEIVSGSGTTFQVKPVDPNGLPFNLYGLEFYTVRSSASNAVVHVSDNDVIQYNTVAVRGSTGTNTLSSSLNEYNGTWGISLITAIQIRRVTCTGATSATDIKVFHSRVSERIGMNVLTPYTLFTGVLPAACKTFLVRGTNTMDWVSGIVNWSDLQSIEYFSVANLGGGSFGITNPAFIPQPPQSLIGLGLSDMSIASTLNLANFGWITDANLPNLEKLDIRSNITPGDMAGTSVAWFPTIPKVGRQFIIQNNNSATHASAANSDTIWNSIGTALTGITPASPSTIRVEDTTAVTAASLTARNNLIAAGWTLTFT